SSAQLRTSDRVDGSRTTTRTNTQGGAMNQLLERVRPLIDMNIPTELLLLGLDRTTRYTDTQVGEAMRYVITAGDLGEEQEEIEFIPLPEPAEAPVQEPSPEPAPAEPVPA